MSNRLEFVVTTRLQLARGMSYVTMASGTAIPAVCGVFGSDVFECEARVQRLVIDGPVPGATTLCVCKLGL